MACGLCVEAVACDLCAGVAAHDRVACGMVACAATLVALCAVSRLAGSRRASTDGSNYCVHPTTWNCRQCTNAAIEKSASFSAKCKVLVLVQVLQVLQVLMLMLVLVELHPTTWNCINVQMLQ